MGDRAAAARPGVTLVVTTYREADVLAGTLSRIANALRGLERPAEIVFVDDGSGDDTPDWVRSRLDGLADLSPRLLVHERNRGRGAALKTGFAASRMPYAGYLDLDLEVDVKWLPPLLAALDSGADAAVGSRVYVPTRGGPDLRTILSLGYRRLSRAVLRHPFSDTEAGFKAFRTDALRRLLPHSREDGWFFDTEICMLFFLSGLRVTEVPIQFLRRRDKVSTVKVGRDVLRYLVALFRFARRGPSLRSALR